MIKFFFLYLPLVAFIGIAKSRGPKPQPTAWRYPPSSLSTLTANKTQVKVTFVKRLRDQASIEADTKLLDHFIKKLGHYIVKSYFLIRPNFSPVEYAV